jgi:hypothetical protein
MTITQHYFAEGRYLGATERKLIRVHDTLSPPLGSAFFCPYCAEVWARCPVEINGSSQLTMVWTLSCRKHPAHYGCGVPGSLFLTWDKSFNDSLPEDAIRREFSVHMDFAESKGMIL